MKILSYSLFGDPSSFEFGYYLRGVYFNARMNIILFPDFITWINLDIDVYHKYEDFFLDLNQLIGVKFYTLKHEQRCKSMLWRLLPMYLEMDATYVICRDLDSVSTYREALCTYEWLNSGMPFHAINDNAAHGGLMGGLVAFKTDEFKKATGYTSFEQMVKGLDLKNHGSDQNFLNKSVLPKIKNQLFLHKLKGAGCEAKVIKTEVPASGPIDKKLWLSNLVQPYIGSAGCIDMELLRFFQTFDKNEKFDEFERKFKDVCYWVK